MPFEAAAMKDLLVWISHVCPCVSVYFLQVLLFPPTVQRHTAHLTDWQVFHEYWYISFEQKIKLRHIRVLTSFSKNIYT